MSTIVLIVLIVFVLGPLANGWARRLKSGTSDDGEARAEIGRLRSEMERLTAQVDRLTEEQAFMMRLLEGRERQPQLPGDSPAEGARATNTGGPLSRE